MTIAPSTPAIQEVYANEFEQPELELDWLWHGYLARGMISLLTSRAKAGKTTLLSLLLKRLETGGTLAGLPVRPARAFIASEEDRQHWRPRHVRLHFGDGLCFTHRPFGGRQPTPAEWDILIDHMLDHQARGGLGLAVIDTIGHFLPTKSEADSTCMLNALRPLNRLTAAGLAVLLLHHPGKRVCQTELAARGSTALVGFADILIDMHLYRPGDTADRRRKLLASSRSDATVPRHVIELDEAGLDYRSLGNLEQAEHLEEWVFLEPVLTTATRKLTRREILRALPKPRSAPITVWRRLEYAVETGQLLRDGQGNRYQPHRFWLPASEERWLRDGSPEYQKQKEDDELYACVRRLSEGKAAIATKHMETT